MRVLVGLMFEWHFTNFPVCPWLNQYFSIVNAPGTSLGFLFPTGSMTLELMVPMASTILVTGIIGMISVGGWWQSFVTEI